MANSASQGSPSRRPRGDDRSHQGRTGTDPGFVENGARVVAIDQRAPLEDQARRLDEDDPDHRLRGEDQLVDGESRLDPTSDLLDEDDE